jgi:hypothetical protein
MALEAKFRISVDGKDELPNVLGRGESSLKRFSSTAAAELGRAGRDIASFAGSAVRALGAIGGIGAGVGIAEQARGVIELRDAIVGVAATAGLAEDQIGGLKTQLLETARATHQFGSDLTEALNAFVAKTGDIETGRKNLELYGRTATAARASVADIANIGADLNKLKITDQATALAVLAKQADIGTVELKDMVSQGPRVLAALAGAGLTGEQGLRRGGALFQVARSATGTSDMATTVVERMLSDVVQKQRLVEGGLGVQVFDPKTHAARDRVQVILDVVAKSGGREDILRKVFGEESIRGALALANEYRATGGFGTFNKFAGVQADSSLIDQKFALNTSTAAAKIKQGQIGMQIAADTNLGDTIESVAGNAGVGTNIFDFITAHPLIAGGGAVAGLAAKQLATRGLSALAGRAGRSLFGGSAGGAGALGEAASAALGGSGDAPRVFVVNWPAGGLLGEPSTASKVTDGIASKVGDAVKVGSAGFLRQGALTAFTSGGASLLGATLGVAAAGVIGFKVGEAIDKALDLSGRLAGTHGADDDKSGKAKSATQRLQEGKTATDLQRTDQMADIDHRYANDNQAAVARRLAQRLLVARRLASQGVQTNFTPEVAAAEFDRFAKSSGGTNASWTKMLRAGLMGGDEQLGNVANRRLDLVWDAFRGGRLATPEDRPMYGPELPPGGLGARELPYSPGTPSAAEPPWSAPENFPMSSGESSLFDRFGGMASSALDASNLGGQLEALKSALFPSPEELARQYNLQIIVQIDGDQAQAEMKGARSPKAMVRRGAH